jgi:hypothetical protein
MWNIPDTDFVSNDPDGQVVGCTSFLGSTPTVTRGYVRSWLYYEQVCKELKSRNISEVHLSCGGLSVESNQRSKEYVYRLKTLLRAHGLTVVDLSDRNADTIFQIFSNALVFIPSGGGYTRLIASLVKKRGHEVLEPVETMTQ